MIPGSSLLGSGDPSTGEFVLFNIEGIAGAAWGIMWFRCINYCAEDAFVCESRKDVITRV